MGGAHSFDNGWTLGSQGVGKVTKHRPVLVSAALVDPQRGGQTTLSASQVAVGSKRLRIVELGTPYKRPMSSSGRLSVYVMIVKPFSSIHSQSFSLCRQSIELDGVPHYACLFWSPLSNFSDPATIAYDKHGMPIAI
ncbi:jg6745 [Pararge aegeria aegeria]|uniref:Jg6745 protein n=1 Tax=Pararge aegeria aegeria TaxID=348720 RepID=A0A8S4R4Q6_9NEOP|nr:jg6745 [Pararge aegeria aegeria]